MFTSARLVLVIVLSFIVVSAPGALALDRRELDTREALMRFDRDPRAFLNELPAREDSRGRPFPPGSIGPLRRDFIALKGAMRDRIREHGISMHARIEPNDNPADVVDRFVLKDLASIERAGLTSAKVPRLPWSGSYWPMAQGLLAQRYADRAFPGSFDWKQNSAYILSHLNSSSVETLSPAEKYDLLVGDNGSTLTRENLDEGGSYYRTYGTVEGWMGICHGWAPASYMETRPATAITVIAADGKTKIPLYPSDLKGLASLLWANGSFRTRSIGTRCDTESPPTDENGRIIDQACFDENPGSWHMAIVNQIGVSRRSLVLDASYDIQVWNQPAIGYSYTLFNPQTKQPAQTLAEAEVKMADFTSDKFRKYRSADAAYVVGIAMDLTYGAETALSTRSTDGPGDDNQATVHYMYDLELDSQRQIIGGEWYQNAHPDFLWTPALNTRAVSVADYAIAERNWSGGDAFPAAWTAAATRASREGQPLAKAVETLLVLSAAGIR
jgi:hypothetical protein